MEKHTITNTGRGGILVLVNFENDYNSRIKRSWARTMNYGKIYLDVCCGNH